MSKGTVYLVGAGPGDAGLITVKGLSALESADVVVYDFLASERLLERAKKGAEVIYVGKKGGIEATTQDEINEILIDRAKKGKSVVRLKGGDPFIFGRGAEEAEELVEAGLDFEVIPGVTSAIAAPAYAGIPLTHRDFASSVTFITGHEDPLKERPNIAWDRLSTGRGTLVFLMGWKNLSFIAGKLMENGWPEDTPIALIRWGTMTKQVCVAGTLKTIVGLSKESNVRPPVVIVVGEVVRLRDKLNWFEDRPLFGVRVVVTRALEQAGDFTKLLEQNGAVPYVFPVIKTVRPASWAPMDKAIRNLSKYDWAVFTSVNGVRFFFERLGALGLDVRELKGVRLCAIGPRTADAIKAENIGVDLTPAEYVAEGIIKALGARSIRGKSFLLARALVAREVLPTEIRRLGGRMDVVTAYRTTRPKKEAAELRMALLNKEIDAVTFTSSSTVTNFAGSFKKGEAKELLKGVTIASIGPVTAETASKLGIHTDVMPKEYTIKALTKALEEFYRTKKKRGER